MNNKDILSQTISLLRLPLVVLVVYIHNFGLYDIPYRIDWGSLDGMSIYNIIRIYVSWVISQVAVPIFFLFSGLLFFSGFKEWDWKVYYRKICGRSLTLVVPYLSWICLTLFHDACIKIGSIIYHGGCVSEIVIWMKENISISSFWNVYSFNSDRLNWLGEQIPVSAPYLFPLWFVRDLIVMFLLSPLMFPL